MAVEEIDGYEVDFESELGSGSFADVFEAKNVKTGERVAAKEIKSRNRKDLDLVQKEINSMRSVSHRNLVKYLHYYESPERELWVFLELCDLGNLVTYFVKNNPDDPESFQLMEQMTIGVTVLHDRKIVHRDIKPGNILLVSKGNNQIPLVKICDFGLAKMIDTTMMSFSTMRIGSRMFMAPELFDSDENVRANKFVDIFALGLTFFSMICFKPGDKNLVPSEDNNSKIEVGFNMFTMLQNSESEEAESYHKKVVEIKGDETQDKIRGLILKMICCDRKIRVASSDVLRDLRKITRTSKKGAEDSGLPDSKILQKQLNSLTVIKTDRVIHAVRSDSQNLACAASMVKWDKSILTVRLWDVTDLKERSWRDHDLVVSHALDQSPRSVDIIAILDNMLLLRVKLDDESRSQIIAVDSSTAQVLHKSRVYSADGIPNYCLRESQIMLPDTKSSSINQLDVETLHHLSTWTDERVRAPWKVCSNKNRAAVRHESGKSISVFKWEDEQLSHDMIYTVKCKDCRGIQLLHDNTLMGINTYDQWSVWNESGAPVHTSVQHPALASGLGNSWLVLQDPMSEECFVYEQCELQDKTDCTLVYNTRIVMKKLETRDKSKIDKSQLKLNKTVEFK